jgi:ubiquinone/menaquinone biosynthesis C-methylase UbiE
MKWTPDELDGLEPVLDRIRADLDPLAGKAILVLCSALGDLAFWLAERMPSGRVVGFELGRGALDAAVRSLEAKQFGDVVVEFHRAKRTRIPAEEATYDALVSDFIVFPTADPTRIGQREMARVLKPGGVMIVTDVIAPRPMPKDHKEALRSVGLDYICEARAGDFVTWMRDAGLSQTETVDLSGLLRTVWQGRRAGAGASAGAPGYSLLLDDPHWRVGEGVQYVYARGRKPEA